MDGKTLSLCCINHIYLVMELKGITVTVLKVTKALHLKVKK